MSSLLSEAAGSRYSASAVARTPMKTMKLDPRLLKAFRDCGRVGGQTRAKNLSAEKRSEISRKAAAARWKKK